MLPLQGRVDMGAMALIGNSTFPKVHHYWNLTYSLFSVISETIVGEGGSYLSTEKQLVYSKAPADWAKKKKFVKNVFQIAEENLRGVVVNVPNCNIVVNEYELNR